MPAGEQGLLDGTRAAVPQPRIRPPDAQLSVALRSLGQEAGPDFGRLVVLFFVFVINFSTSVLLLRGRKADCVLSDSRKGIL